MADIPTVITAAGLQPTPPAALRATLIALVSATNPDYTANLPGALIEDISSTDVGALSLIDSAKVDLVNSLTPFGANEFMLLALGAIYGVSQGQDTNTSVLLVFSGTAGFIIPQGFTVSDGTHQYVVQDGGVIGSDTNSQPLFAVATQSGSWAVPAGTVQQIVTSVPTGITLTVNNPSAGTPSPGAQTAADYRAQVLQGGLAAAQGMPRFLKTLLLRVSGVQSRLISVLQQTGGWEIIVGGGDPYQVAGAIYQALFDISNLIGSTLNVTNISNGNPGVVTMDLNHGYATGQIVNIAGVVGMTGINNVPFTISVVSEKAFSIGIDTTGSGTYVNGGVVTPNLRNQVISINDFPNTYQVPYVIPPAQNVTISLLWSTISTNYVNPATIAQLGAPALMDYVNSIVVGQPMNLFELQNAFQEAVANVLPTPLLTRMAFTVLINGVSTAPTAGTGIIAGDPESYFVTNLSSIAISQG